MDALSNYFSENSVIRYEAAVEAAIMVVMERYGIVPAGSGEQMKNASGSITPVDRSCSSGG